MGFPVAIVSTFLESYSRQTERVRGRINAFLEKFIERGPTHPGFKYKPMEGDVDPRIREVRVDGTYRAIVLHPSHKQPYRFLWVDIHDPALEWPKGRQFHEVRNEIWIVDTHLHEAAAREAPTRPRTDAPFARFSSDDLHAAGLSLQLIPAVRALRSADDLDALCADLAPGPASLLETLYVYGSADEARAHLPVAGPSAGIVEVIDEGDPLARTLESLQHLTLDQARELVRSPIWKGIVRLDVEDKPVAEEGARSRRVESIRLDPAQQRFAHSLDEGPRLLKGVAGSGKTLLLASLAVFKAMRGVERILVTCYNLALTRYIRSLLDANLLNPLHRARIDVASIFELCGSILGATVRHEGEDQAYYDGLVTAALKAARSADARYDAVLVDEAQDLSPEMLKLLGAVAKGKKPDIKFAEDTHQDVFARRPAGFSWKSVVGVSMRGRTTILRTSYRSTVQICDAADDLAGAPLSRTVEDEDGQQILLQREDRSGPEVERHDFAAAEALADHVVAAIERLIEDRTPLAEIAVLYTRSLKPRVLEQTGIPFDCLGRIQERLGDERVRLIANSTDKLELDITENTVKMGSVYAFKGLDFEAVFLLDAVGDAPRLARVLFVGATRARERLSVVRLVAPGP
jgi:hypothetical protein